jgi:hypothetical protein
MQSTRAVLPLAQRWLKECCDSHLKCKSSNKRMPTRLVSTEENKVRLVAGFQKCLKYATLSHCWGKIKFLMLKRSNLEALEIRIQLEMLSQTFKDAIEVARELGLAYIWIDSLCIVQDDPDDWIQESELMSDVYSGSCLNIAASGVIDGRSGCFFESLQNRECKIQVKLGSKFCSYDCVTSEMYTSCLSNMPLMERGWTLQNGFSLLKACTLPRRKYSGNSTIKWHARPSQNNSSPLSNLTTRFSRRNPYQDRCGAG